MALLQRLSFIILFFTLASCGGGGGGGFDGGGTDPDNTEPDPIVMSWIKTDGDLSVDNPITVTATLMRGNAVVPNKLVTFSLNDTERAFFDPSTGDSNSTGTDGIAVVILNAGSSAGGVEITVSCSDCENFETITFNSLGDGNITDSPDVADIGLFASSQQLASSGAQEIELTAIAKDANNNLVEGVAITFSSTSGQIEVTTPVTGADGKASAILKTDNEPTNRIIDTTATTGSVSDAVSVQVVGTTVSLSGSSSLAINDANNYIINVLNSDGEAIANTVVNISLTNISTETPASAIANITLPATVTTDFTGQATLSVTGTSGGTNSIVASALGATVTQNVAVQADSFLFTAFNDGNGGSVDPSSAIVIPDVLLSDTASVTLTWLRSGSPVPDGTMVNFTTTRGTLMASSATTLAGQITATLTSNNAGKALVTFTGTEGDISLNNQLEFEFIAETVATVVAQASPKSIGPSGQASTISVVVKDANGNLVKNKTIDFTLTDTNGGTIFPASAVTDSNGNASTVFTSNAVSAQDGISITTTVREQPTQTDTVTLTVADRELFIRIGTGNEIIEHDITTYNKQFTVFVTDVDSNPIENAALTISAVPNNYYKGRWWPEYDGDEFVAWRARGENSLFELKHFCGNEDVNIDGILDVGEDTNTDGLLTPGNVVAAEGEVITDEQGQAVIDILYPQSYGHWVDVKLIFSAKVNGTESFAETIFTLPVFAEDVINEDISPPIQAVGLDGPFGVVANCNIPD